jgi:hypothetical protein
MKVDMKPSSASRIAGHVDLPYLIILDHFDYNLHCLYSEHNKAQKGLQAGIFQMAG